MAAMPPEGQLFKEELERVLSSASFARSGRASQLLRFLVEQHLEGKDDELKESLIGVGVFGRSPDYDPKLDSTVRTEAARLRAHLSRYYLAEGRHDPFVIDVPKGAYVPRCLPRVVDANQASHAQVAWLAIGVIALVVAAAVSGVRWMRSNPVPVSIAVLPLTNLTGNSDDDYFVDGLTDEIIRQVSGIKGLAVRSQTSSFTLKGKPRTVREAGGELNVQYIVEGSLSEDQSQMRITAQLIRVRDDVTVWAGTFDRHGRDALVIQEDISRGIVNALKFKLGQEPRSYDPQAYDLYLRARAVKNERFPGDDEAITLFERAIAQDASIAPAYSGLADAYAFRSFAAPLDLQRTEELDKMRAAAERAIQLDPQLAEAHSALGAVYARNAQWDLAERSFQRAIELDPSASFARDAFARFVLWPLGRMSEAVREARAGAEDDPLSSRARVELADVLLAAGRFDEAAEQCEQLPVDMVSGRDCMGRARLAQGRPADAIRVLSASATNNWGYLAYAYAKAGQRKEAEALTAAAPQRYPSRRGPFQYALAFAGFEDKDRTIEQLQRMAGVGPVRMGFTLRAPEFVFLDGDPRVKALRKQVGLPE